MIPYAGNLLLSLDRCLTKASGQTGGRQASSAAKETFSEGRGERGEQREPGEDEAPGLRRLLRQPACPRRRGLHARDLRAWYPLDRGLANRGFMNRGNVPWADAENGVLRDHSTRVLASRSNICSDHANAPIPKTPMKGIPGNRIQSPRLNSPSRTTSSSRSPLET